MHHQRRLHAHGGAVTGVDPLHLPGGEAVGDVVRLGAAVLGRQRGAEQPELAELVHDLAMEYLVAVGLEHPWHEAVLAIVMTRIADHALVFGELLVQQQRIFPVETCLGCGHEHSDIRFCWGRKEVV